MSDTDLSPAARAYLWGVAGAGAVVLAWAGVVAFSWSAGDVAAWAAIAVGAALSEQFALPLHHKGGNETFAVTDAVIVAGVLLARPSVVILGAVTGSVVGLVATRVEATKIAFNAGQDAVAIGIATLVYRSLASGPGSAVQRDWIVATVAMAAYFLVNELAIAGVISLAGRLAFASVLLPTLALSAVTWAGNVAMGILGAFVWQVDRLAAPLLVVPSLLSFLAYRSWLRTTQEREQMHAIAESAAAISAAADLTRRMPEQGSTEQVAGLARTLNGMLGRLEESLAREHRFLRDASHELRTPLTICRGHLEVLSDDPSPEEIESTHAVVIGELARMGRIVEDMSTLVRSEHAGFLRTETVAVGDLLERLGRSAGLFLNGSLVVDECPPGTVSADPQRLTQALLNLIRNAEVHARSDGVHVGADVADSGASWLFYVRDRGGGLPPGSENAVFQPFRRMDHSRPGSGLGLAIVRGIAEAHGGTAGVDNYPGVGATFWIRIPSTPGGRA